MSDAPASTPSRSAGLPRLIGVAVAVFRGDQAYCNRVFQAIRDTLGWHVEVEFFDSESPGCWIYAD